MKQILPIFILIAFSHTSKADLNIATDSCRIYEIKEANAIKSACALINDKDFEDARKRCISDKKKMSESCQTAQRNIQSQMYELTNSYQQYLQKKEAQASGFSNGSDQHLDDFLKKANDALTMVETFKAGSQCDISSSAASLLPIVSLLNAPAGLILGAGQGLIGRLVQIFKTQKLGIASKLAICESNKKFQQARTEACLTLEMSDPKYREIIKHQMEWLDQKCLAAQQSKTYLFLQNLSDTNSYVGYLKNQPADQSTKQLAGNFSERINELLSQIDCKNPFSKSICDKLTFLKTSLQSTTFTDSKANTQERNEAVLRISRVYDDLQEEVAGVSFDKKSKNYYLTAESIDTAKKAENCFFNRKLDSQRKELYQRQLSENLNFNSSARMIKDSILSLPNMIPNNLESGLCQATACIWGDAKADPTPSQRALSGKNLHPKGWDPVGNQSLPTYVKAGAATFQNWDLVVSEKDKFFKRIAETCKSQSSNCQISCRESDEELMRRQGNHINTDERGTNIVEPTRARGAN